MKLQCEACGSTIPAEDVNLEMALAKCRECDNVFSFLPALGDAAAVNAPAAERLPAPMPKRFRVEELGKDLTITFRWFTPVLFFLVFFCIIWDGFLVVWYSMAFGEIFGGKRDPMMWIMVVFPVIHLLVGVFLTYYTISAFVNKTVIRAAGGELSVSHGPFPWGGNHRVPINDVRQVYCTETSHHGKHGHRYSYTVNVLRRDDTKLKLLSSIQELDEALFIEQKLRQHLGLSDERVPGSLASEKMQKNPPRLRPANRLPEWPKPVMHLPCVLCWHTPAKVR